VNDTQELLDILERHVNMSIGDALNIVHNEEVMAPPEQPTLNMFGGKLNLFDTVINFGDAQMYFDPKDKKLKLDVNGEERVIG